MAFNLKTVMAHKPPMLLVDELLEVQDGCAVTCFLIKEDNIFLNKDGLLAREALAEIMAQSFAALNAYNGAKENKKEEKGFLVGLRNIVVHADARLGDSLKCRVRAVDFIAQTYIVEGQIFKDDVLLAEGELRLFTF